MQPADGGPDGGGPDGGGAVGSGPVGEDTGEGVGGVPVVTGGGDVLGPGGAMVGADDPGGRIVTLGIGDGVGVD